MDDIKKRLGELLNRHGYPFQYSILRRSESLYSSRASPWLFQACEFPVEVQGKSTRIDFILKSDRSGSHLLLAECKRADPKFSHWCFVKAPMVHRRRESEYPMVDRVRYGSDGKVVVAFQYLNTDIKDNAYHLGFVLKDPHKAGDSGRTDEDAIEKAATQVCRGANGLIQFMERNGQLLQPGAENLPGSDGKVLIPVVFTTATLHACDCNLSSANLGDGKLNISQASLIQKPWIYFQYPLSPEIKHTARRAMDVYAIEAALDYEYIRTILVVSAGGIDQFFSEFEPWKWNPIE
jgi:hypothetical protein